MPQRREEPSPAPRGRRLLIIIGVALAGLGVLGGLGWAFGRPALVDAAARERLDRVEERLGLAVRYERLTLEGGDRVLIEGLEIGRRAELTALDPAPLLKAPRVEIEVDVWGSLTGDAQIEAVRIDSPEIALVRSPEGASDLDPLVTWIDERLAKRDDPAGEDAAERRRLPRLEVHGGRLRVEDRYTGGAPRALPRNLGALLAWTSSPLTGADEIEALVELPEGRPGPGGQARLSARLTPAPKHPLAPSVPERVELTAAWPEPADPAGEAPPARLEARAEPAWHLSALPGLDGCAATLQAFGLEGREIFARTLRVEGPEGCPLDLKAARLGVELGDARPLGALRLEDATVEIEGAAALRQRLLLAVGDTPAGGGAGNTSDALGAALLEDLAPDRLIVKDAAVTLWEEERGGAQLVALRHVGAELTWTPAGRVVQGRASAEFDAQGAVSLQGEVGLKARRGDLKVTFEHVEAGFAGRALGISADLWKAGEVSGEVQVKTEGPEAAWSLTGHVQGQRLTLEHFRLASTPITDLSLRLEGAASWDPATRALRVRDGALTLGEARLGVEVELDGLGIGQSDAPVDLKHLRFKLNLPRTDAQRLFAQIPEAFKSQLSAMRFQGELGFRLEADIDTRDISGMKTDGDLDIKSLRVAQYDPRADVRGLTGPFHHEVTQPETGYVFSIDASPEVDGRWVPLSRVSPYVAKGVFTNEDGSFYKHKGFSWLQVKSSVEDNLEAGRFRRGASTLSMQVIKNLFLTSEKTLARKFQEAVLTFCMEQVEQTPKDRILEIYLNIIEWAPGVYGVRGAAQHYFGVHPADLSLAEAVYLITIIPGPRKYHSHYARGEISDAWWDRMQRLMKIMLERGHITQEEYDQGVARRPTFWKGSGMRPPPEETRKPAVVPLEGIFP